jgi:hypothetical protein
MLTDMKTNTPITQTAEGGTARSVLEVVNERLDDTYDYVDIGISAAYVSTATGNDLDKIGALLNCSRLTNESDTNYRYRVTQQVYIAAKSNKIALKLKCLAVSGVTNIIETPYTYGLGSFTFHVISNDLDTPDSLVRAVQAVIDENKAEGIKGIAAKPKLVPVDISVRLVLAPGVTTQEGNSISYDVQSKIEDYVNDLGMGTPINSMDVYQIAGQSRVTEVSVELVRINNRVVGGSPTEYACKWDERFYSRTIKVIV